MYGGFDEIWVVVEVEGRIFEDYYISSLGRLYSVKLDKILSGSITTKGYIMDKFTERDEYNNKITTSCTRHKMVLYSFGIYPYDNCNQIDHINGDKTDNSINNLEWVDCKTNVNRSWENGLHVNDKRSCEYSHNVKYKREDIEKACELKIQGYKNAEISRLLNISLDTLHKVFNGKQWKEVYELYENELIKVQRLSKPHD